MITPLDHWRLIAFRMSEMTEQQQSDMVHYFHGWIKAQANEPTAEQLRNCFNDYVQDVFQTHPNSFRKIEL